MIRFRLVSCWVSAGEALDNRTRRVGRVEGCITNCRNAGKVGLAVSHQRHNASSQGKSKKLKARENRGRACTAIATEG